MKAKPHVLDASALMGLFESRPYSSVVLKLLEQAQVLGVTLYMSAVNWGEVYYNVWKHHGLPVAEDLIRKTSQLAIQIVPADQEVAKQAATLKVRFGLPYADAFAAATAVTLGGWLVTADPHFERVKHHIKIQRL